MSQILTGFKLEEKSGPGRTNGNRSRINRRRHSAAFEFGAELVDQAAAHLRLLDDALFVVLPDRARELVVVHVRPVLAQPPQLRHFLAVFDLENAFEKNHVRMIE